ncbi:unnamed protein product, partial [Cladocopium goreaui]
VTETSELKILEAFIDKKNSEILSRFEDLLQHQRSCHQLVEQLVKTLISSPDLGGIKDLKSSEVSDDQIPRRNSYELAKRESNLRRKPFYGEPSGKMPEGGQGGQEKNASNSPWKSWKLETAFAGIILSNAILLGIQTEWASRNLYTEEPVVFRVLQTVYAMLFVGEIAWRISLSGCKAYLCSADWGWHTLDLFVTFSAVLDVVMTLGGGASLTGRSNSGFRLLRVMKIARLVRAIRVVKVLRFIRALRVLVFSIIHTMRSLVWSLVLLFVIMYSFGILFADAITDYILQNGDNIPQHIADGLVRHFGSLVTSMNTLFRAISGGVTWEAPAEFLHYVGVSSVRPRLDVLTVRASCRLIARTLCVCDICALILPDMNAFVVLFALPFSAFQSQIRRGYDFIPENSAFSDILPVLIQVSLGFPQPSNQSAQNSLAVSQVSLGKLFSSGVRVAHGIRRKDLSSATFRKFRGRDCDLSLSTESRAFSSFGVEDMEQCQGEREDAEGTKECRDGARVIITPPPEDPRKEEDAGCPPETVSTSITLLGFQFMGVTQRKAKDRELTRLTEAKEVLRKCRLAASPAPPATAEWHGRCGLVTGARQDLAANHDVNYTGRPGLIVENATTQSNGPPEMTRNGKKWQLTIDVPRSGRQIADALSEYGSVDVEAGFSQVVGQNSPKKMFKKKKTVKQEPKPDPSRQEQLRDNKDEDYTILETGLTLVLSADAMNQLGITLSRWQVGKTGMAETKFKFGRDWMAEELVDFLKQQGPRKTWDEIKDQPPQTANTRGRPAKRQAKEPDERHRSRSAAEKPEKGDENKDPMEVEKTQLDSQTQPEAIDKQSSKPTSQSLGNLTDALTQHWTLADQGGCGDCGYRALIDNFHYQTTGETLSKEECIKNANLFRTEVVRHVRKHQDRYENHVRGGKEAFPAFCDNALKQTHWICGLLLQAAAEVKSCCIVVWNQKDEVLERFTFAPEWSPQGMARMKKEAPILVVYRNDKHYQSVRPPQDQDGMTKVPKHWARETAKPEAEALGGAGPSVGESPKTLHTLSPGSSHAPSLHTLPASSFRGSSGGGVMITRAPSLHSLVPSASSPPRLRAVVHGHAAGGGSSGALARPHPPRSPSLLTLAASPHSCDRSGTKDKGAVKNDNTECDFRPDTAPYPRHLKRLDAKSQSRPRNFLKVAEPGVAQNAGKAAQAAGHLVTEVLPPDAMTRKLLNESKSNWLSSGRSFPHNFQSDGQSMLTRAAAPDMLQRVSPALLRKGKATEATEVLSHRLRDAWRIRKYEEFLELDRPAPRRLEPPPFYSGDRLWPTLRLRASAGSVIVYIITRQVMTGVFCHSAITGAEKDQDLVVQALLHEKAAIKNKLMELFERVDDGTGRIGPAEFEMQFENEAVKAVFESLGLGTMDAWTLFQILDSDGNRFIDMDEFVESCIRNRGSAKAVDVCALRHQINKVRRQLSDMAGLQKQMLLQCAAARAATFFC